MGTCRIDGCGRVHDANGLCKMHDNRRRRGTPLDGPVRHYQSGTPAQRLWARIDRTDPSACWLWPGFRTTRGYGLIRLGGQDSPRTGTHRLAYEDTYGPIPPGLVIDHLCRTPLCCNPAHLEAVTQRENVRRGRRCAP